MSLRNCNGWLQRQKHVPELREMRSTRYFRGLFMYLNLSFSLSMQNKGIEEVNEAGYKWQKTQKTQTSSMPLQKPTFKEYTSIIRNFVVDIYLVGILGHFSLSGFAM